MTPRGSKKYPPDKAAGRPSGAASGSVTPAGEAARLFKFAVTAIVAIEKD
jgi:hypothetical protein